MLKLADEKWDDNADILAMLVRMAFPNKPEEMQNYISNAKENTKVFRVTVPVNQVKNLKRSLFSKPKLIDRKMGRKESVVDENVKEVISNAEL